MNIRLVQLDGPLPNLALMKLAHWHKAKGDVVHLTYRIMPELFEPQYDVVYGSAIFRFSQDRITEFRRQWPNAVLGGTGTDSLRAVEEITGEYEHYDYSGYQKFDASIGFTQRGCRLSCKFCVVPKKEGKPRSVNSINDIWRGEPWPKKIHLLDNDFFGQEPVKWMKRCQEIVSGGFRVCLSQGINIRMVNVAAAKALSMMQYRDADFNRRRLYTAWDNLGDEKAFFTGVQLLEDFGIPPKHLMVYMLIGYDKHETWDKIWHRFNRMVERGVLPYPMVYDRTRSDLVCFQRWVNTGLYRCVPWDKYERETKSKESVESWHIMRSVPGRLYDPLPILQSKN